LLDLTHVVTDVVLGWSPEEKDVLNIMFVYSPKGRTVHHKLLPSVYCPKNPLQVPLVFLECGKSPLNVKHQSGN